MKQAQAKLYEFHRKFGAVVNTKPTILDEETRKLRMCLIEEECFEELFDAMLAEDMVEIADGLADTLYVLLGTACAYGIDLEPVFNEVHRSNMSKLWAHCKGCGAELGCDNGQLVHKDSSGLTCLDCDQFGEFEVEYRVHRNEAGKILKPSTYSPADVATVLAHQMHLQPEQPAGYVPRTVKDQIDGDDIVTTSRAAARHKENEQ
jgi:NTP pyrophosphatase (non-canonical NTP hydrolase)